MQKLLSRHQGKLSHGTIPEMWQTTIAKGEKRTLNEYVPSLCSDPPWILNVNLCKLGLYEAVLSECKCITWCRLKSMTIMRLHQTLCSIQIFSERHPFKSSVGLSDSCLHVLLNILCHFAFCFYCNVKPSGFPLFCGQC